MILWISKEASARAKQIVFWQQKNAELELYNVQKQWFLVDLYIYFTARSNVFLNVFVQENS